ncbi:hypothetical protein HELRODRAFT_184827 [Helobdella robusta]|uniref:Zinc transporter ZIP11 n=1 Tax=Helobdella robusta TaxID=6412 RepID=T1FM21_HELRO|nr:hypothetical protein HELRODRAFT_184827 [Helobdella robusta]ESO12483.1 hypothetical protein HELRODRAFT_184827 [Helobdella robusta]
MIDGFDPVVQAFFGTLFTWAVTALGSGFVFFCHNLKRQYLDASLGFAAGVMVAASFWSLLEPSIEHAKLSGLYGEDGQYSFIPALVGFLFGTKFVILTDYLLPSIDFNIHSAKDDKNESTNSKKSTQNNVQSLNTNLTQRNKSSHHQGKHNQPEDHSKQKSWKRILLLIIAITVHNIPEGLAVGVSFGSIGRTPSSTFAKSRNLAMGIGIQNFPEGLAVSIPLKASGMSMKRSFWYGQLSGMVEPIFGVLGAICVTLVDPLLPYVLAFAAGAMIFVVFDDIIPEAQSCGNTRVASLGVIVGFVIMMVLDVALE